jgi:hypothetical protein
LVLLRIDKPAWAEIGIILDEEADFKVILGVGTCDLDTLLSDLHVFLQFQHLFQMLCALARLE